MKCAFCQNEVVVSERVGRRDVCSHCGRDLHCCCQCHFYDKNVHHECREPQADYVKEKDQANFCDYFRFDPKIQAKVEDAAAKAKFENLFKKNPKS